MHERCTEAARRVMLLANEGARHLNHEFIGTEHILLGLVRLMREGSGVGGLILKALGQDDRKIRLEVEKKVKPNREIVVLGAKLPHTPRAKKVLDFAFEEARFHDHNYVGTEHILAGLLHEHDGVAAKVLMGLGVTHEMVRVEIGKLVGPDTEIGYS